MARRGVDREDADPGAPFGRLDRVKVFRRYWLPIGALLVVVAFIAVCWLAEDEESFRRSQYEGVRLGMTRGEVEAVLGPPRGRDSAGLFFAAQEPEGWLDTLADEARDYAPPNGRYWIESQERMAVGLPALAPQHEWRVDHWTSSGAAIEVGFLDGRVVGKTLFLPPPWHVRVRAFTRVAIGL